MGERRQPRRLGCGSGRRGLQPGAVGLCLYLPWYVRGLDYVFYNRRGVTCYASYLISVLQGQRSRAVRLLHLEYSCHF